MIDVDALVATIQEADPERGRVLFEVKIGQICEFTGGADRSTVLRGVAQRVIRLFSDLLEYDDVESIAGHIDGIDLIQVDEDPTSV